MAEAEAMLFEDLGVVVVDRPPDQIRALSVAAGANNAILAIEPERIVYALGLPRRALAFPRALS